MQWQTFLPIIMIAAFAVYFFYVMSKRKKAMQNLGPAFRQFFEQTGYRYANLANAPIEEHVKHAEQSAQNMTRGNRTFEMNMVRDFHGVPVHHTSYMGPPKNPESKHGYVMSCRWAIKLDKPPKAVFEVADKSLSSVGKAVKEAFTSMTREWKPVYEQRIPTGDAELDKRFLVYGEDPESVRRALLSPGMKELLLGCTEVDLCVTDREVFFSDPFQKNVRAGMGGTVGMMAAGFDHGKFMQMSIPIHDRIAELLAVAMRACQ